MTSQCYMLNMTRFKLATSWDCFAGIIAVLIFVLVAVLGIAAKFHCRRKETYQNQEVNNVKQEDSQDFPFGNQTDSHNICTQHPKEYFI